MQSETEKSPTEADLNYEVNRASHWRHLMNANED